ncbi:MAG: hypothetical protein PVG35_15120 [Desulfobacterales bacterium]|jgi:hypothetical protein
MEPQRQTVRKSSTLLPHPTALDLRGRQSVRATFTLSAKAIEAISIVAALLGIKQKSIFDHLIEDAHSLKLIARRINSESLADIERVQKTFVISRKALASLEKAAQKANASRNALVEMSIQRLLPVIARERQKHKIRKRRLNEIKQVLDRGMALLSEVETDLGTEDPITIRFNSAMKSLSSAHNEISAIVDRGELVEDFDLTELTDSTPTI